MKINSKVAYLRESTPAGFNPRFSTQEGLLRFNDEILSPIQKNTDQKNITNCRSFKQIKKMCEGKKNKQHTKCFSKMPSLTKLPQESNFSNQENIFSFQNTEHLQDQVPNIYESVIENTERKHQRKRQPSFAQNLENGTLRETIDILKEQIHLVKEQLNDAQSEVRKYKIEIKKKKQQIALKQKKYKEYEKKSQEFDQLEPKVLELEKMQENLLEQNKKHKQKEILFNSVLNNIKGFILVEEEKSKIMEKESEPFIMQIKVLIEALNL